MTARRLATILAVVTYSCLVSADEADERFYGATLSSMSVVGTKPTCRLRRAMSAFGG